MTSDIEVALIGLGGALIGGLLQSAASWLLGHRQFVRDSRQRDYELFVQAIAEMSQANNPSPERSASTAKVIEGRAKILLHGSPRVVAALERQSRHQILATEESFRAFCTLIEAMRYDVGGKKMRQFGRLARSTIFGASSDGVAQ